MGLSYISPGSYIIINGETYIINECTLHHGNRIIELRLQELRTRPIRKNDIRLTPNKYQELAMRTAKPECRNLSNVGLGLAGEAGECADLIKKHLHQQHPLDKEKLKKELGDVAWYLALGCEVAETTLEEVMRMNIDKLMARYPDGFDPERSKNRSENDV